MNTARRWQVMLKANGEWQAEARITDKQIEYVTKIINGLEAANNAEEKTA